MYLIANAKKLKIFFACAELPMFICTFDDGSKQTKFSCTVCKRKQITHAHTTHTACDRERAHVQFHQVRHSVKMYTKPWDVCVCVWDEFHISIALMLFKLDSNAHPIPNIIFTAETNSVLMLKHSNGKVIRSQENRVCGFGHSSYKKNELLQYEEKTNWFCSFYFLFDFFALYKKELI